MNVSYTLPSRRLKRAQAAVAQAQARVTATGAEILARASDAAWESHGRAIAALEDADAQAYLARLACRQQVCV